MKIRGHFSNYRRLYVHLGIGLLAAVLFFVLTLLWLKAFTLHSDAMQLPDFEGKHMDSLVQFAEEANLRYYIMDSVYNDYLPAGTIVRQDPLPLSDVKPRRKIYITIVATTPEMVVMPNLKDLSVRQAVEVLQMNRLNVDRLEFINGFDRNAVQYQLFNGDTAVPGTELVKGSAITLVASKGLHNPQNPLPFLIGLNRSQAVQAIYNSGFNMGQLDPAMDEEGQYLRVYAQDPDFDEYAAFEPGTEISLKLCPDTKLNFDSLILTYTSDSLNLDSITDLEF